MRVLICGGGVIGASIAYFLSCRGVEATVIERTGIACAASGKSGGFLAAEWCDGSPVQELAHRSFALHAELAERLGGNAWGYRRLNTYGGHADTWDYSHRRGYDIGWLSDNVIVSQQIGSPANTAQVHPALFTTAIMRAAQARGAESRIGRVTGLVRDGNRVTGVDIDGETLAGDAVVIAMGPWSILAAAWLPLPAVFGLKGHSLIFDTAGNVPAEAAFLEYQEGSGEALTPEFFPRPDGTTYVCGISGEEPLPINPTDVAPDDEKIERLHRMCCTLSPVLASAKILARQACYRPITRDGVPLIGPVPGVEGAYIATGHSVWGMLNAPATGEAIAELITGSAARTVDLTPFSPARLPVLDPARLRLDR
ncbi:MAG TPA: FAD-dependent oxidoreductase [Stellaceae bacterium]|jgi:glycine/D-amino acid oxidase-like deaminating enzyme|nr:FAD-dependent oxidoreductase [Stellaceae bacterium]